MKIILLPLLCLLPYAPGTAAINDKEIAVTQKGIEIQLHERTLGEVLTHIQQVSGIRFSFPTAMRSTPIMATIHARDWPSAVRELLRPFSTAEVWNGIQLSKVFLFEQGQPDTSVPNVATEPQEGNTQKPTEADAESPPAAVLLPPLPPPAPRMDTEAPMFERNKEK
jgi:hypothetical protein